jgi:hypothetical protein
MSSHHFVKENQEPFLFVKGKDFPEEIVNQLLEWNPSIICDNNSISYFFNNNKKPDYLFTDQYPFQDEFFDLNIEIVKASEKEINEKLMQLLNANKSSSLNIVCNNIMLEFTNFSSLLESKINFFFFDAKRKLYKKPNTNFSKWQNKGQQTTIIDINGIEIETFIAKQDGVFSFPPIPVYWILESI